MQFDFATSNRIIFGPGRLKEIGPAAAQMGKTALICTGLAVERAFRLVDLLKAAGVQAHLYQVSSEPTLTSLQAALELARQAQVDLVIGFGGGSALDTAKATAALLTNEGAVLDYLEVIGQGKPLSRPGAACLAIPTTAGTGSEVTRNAVVASPEHGVKVSLRSPWMLPRLALIDPELTYDLPPHLTASTGLDALTQLIEPFVSPKANPLTDAVCREGMRRAARSLRKAWETGSDPAAREDMALASLFGGLALANAALGAVHGFAAPIGGMFPGPHGAICARLLPLVMEANLAALQRQNPESEAFQRYTEVARILTGSEQADPRDGIAWVWRLVQDLQIPPLAAYGLSQEHVPLLVERAAQASSMKGNPVRLSGAELSSILERAI